ncbi:MAG: CrcB family protein [Alicyclobacillus sp.]|nr:CrcB family protein [Alicyclobacillus sp.]
MVIIWGFVGIGAAIGSLVRYGMGYVIRHRTRGEFPWGTWTVNLVGTLLFGLFFQEIVRTHYNMEVWNLLGTGFCGGLTTFSSMAVEAMQLFKSRPKLTCVYLGSSFVCGLMLLWLARWIGGP